MQNMYSKAVLIVLAALLAACSAQPEASVLTPAAAIPTALEGLYNYKPVQAEATNILCADKQTCRVTDNALKFKAPPANATVAHREYIVTVDPATPAAGTQAIVRDVTSLRGKVKVVAAAGAWRGLTIQVPAGKQAQRRVLFKLLDNPSVTSIEPNYVISVPKRQRVKLQQYSDSGDVATQAVQSAPENWGLDRVDGKMDSAYNYGTSGAGTCIFVVDTGVAAAGHWDFGGRRWGGGFVPYPTDEANQQDADRNGHGTHVAGIAAGQRFGVAKSALIIPVRVMDNSGSGTASAIVHGVNWVIGYPTSSCPKKIMNLSLGSGTTVQAINDAVAKAVANKVIAVVAAGNENRDACSTSPANVASALTVGATMRPTQGQDARASFSNYGACVDIFAPGQDILSDHWDPRYIWKLSGTSMAAPHVTGLAARLWGSGACSSASACQSLLIAQAQSTMNSGTTAGSPNRMAVLSPSI